MNNTCETCNGPTKLGIALIDANSDGGSRPSMCKVAPAVVHIVTKCTLCGHSVTLDHKPIIKKESKMLKDISEKEMNLINYHLSCLYERQPLLDTKMAGFTTYIDKKFTEDGQKLNMVPMFVVDMIDVDVVDDSYLLTLQASTISLLKTAQPVPFLGNDYTIADYAAVELNGSATSRAKCVIVASFLTLNKMLQWHIANKTDAQFQDLFIPLSVEDSLLEEDDMFIVKFFEPGEFARPLAFDGDEKQMRFAVSPHIKARVMRVRKSIIASTQNLISKSHADIAAAIKGDANG